MPIEIEIKLKVENHDSLRAALTSLGAQRIGAVLETNTFLDTSAHTLLAEDRGLRVRRNTDPASGHSESIITYKGPRHPGPLKRREELELTVADHAQAVELLQALGFQRILTFEKRRESWQLNDCKIDLDELPILGHFIEIEGPSSEAVLKARDLLHLTKLNSLTDSYIALLMANLGPQATAASEITFPQT